MNLLDPIQQQTMAQPDAPALVLDPDVLSYAQLVLAIDACAGHLQGWGVRAGDVVGLSLGNSPVHVVVVLALARLSAASVPLHSSMPAPVRQQFITQLGISRILHDHAASTVTLRDDGVPLMAADSALLQPLPGALLPPWPPADAVYRIALSSGTTGAPKAMALTQRLTTERSMLRAGTVPCGPGVRFMPVFDLHTSAGLGSALRHLQTGSCVLVPRDAQPAQLVSLVRRWNINAVSIPPVATAGMLREVDRQRKQAGSGAPLFPDMVYFGISGSAVPRAMVQAVAAKITPAVFVLYGSTEAGGLSINTPATLAIAPDSVGPIVPGIEAQAVDEQGRVLPAGQLGRLRFRGPAFCDRYLDDPAATARVFADGWYYPGDTGMVDAQGFLSIAGREDDLIHLGGARLNPEAVENVLLACPGIDDAGVYTVYDPLAHLPVLLAAVVSRQPIDAAALRRRCTDTLGPLATPVKILQINAMPRNVAGKLLRRELTARTEVGLAAAQPSAAQG